MVLWGATFNAVVVVGVVSLLLFRLPMAILCYSKKITKMQIVLFSSKTATVSLNPYTVLRFDFHLC
jgi:hypothetical protein